jgi:hypothetical protein
MNDGRMTPAAPDVRDQADLDRLVWDPEYRYQAQRMVERRKNSRRGAGRVGGRRRTDSPV